MIEIGMCTSYRHGGFAKILALPKLVSVMGLGHVKQAACPSPFMM